MRRAMATSLLLTVLGTLGLVCPCPPAAAAPMADDHSCCGKEGFQAATSCCMTSADGPMPAALDAPQDLTPPARAGLAPAATPALGPVPAPERRAVLAPSPPSVLRI